MININLMSNLFVDVHCHISDKLFDETRESVIESTKGKMILLNAGEEYKSNIISLSLQDKYDWVKACIGLHPNIISNIDDNEINKNIEFIIKNVDKAFAISEVGLDYKNKDQIQIKKQKEVLEKIFQIAEKHNKVVIIHTRKAMDDMLDMIKSFKLRVIFHNFEGNLSQCKKACDMNVGISISTGFIKFKKDTIIKHVKDELLFSETDSPALSPDNNINNPINISRIVDYIAKIRGKTIEDIKILIYSNFLRIFYG